MVVFCSKACQHNDSMVCHQTVACQTRACSTDLDVIPQVAYTTCGIQGHRPTVSHGVSGHKRKEEMWGRTPNRNM